MESVKKQKTLELRQVEVSEDRGCLGCYFDRGDYCILGRTGDKMSIELVNGEKYEIEGEFNYIPLELSCAKKEVIYVHDEY